MLTPSFFLLSPPFHASQIEGKAGEKLSWKLFARGGRGRRMIRAHFVAFFGGDDGTIDSLVSSTLYGLHNKKRSTLFQGFSWTLTYGGRTYIKK